MVVVDFWDWDRVLVIHLKMTGQLVLQISDIRHQTSDRVVGGHPTDDWVGKLPSKQTRIIISFKDGSKLFFNDQRVFGWLKVLTRSNVKDQISKMPPDVVDKEFTVGYLAGVLTRTRRPVKLVILDQEKIGGMGNIYANDALWLAGISPIKSAKELKPAEISRLHKAMIKVINRGIELGGSSIINYLDSEGKGGRYQEELLVYGREGEECRKKSCHRKIKKIKLGGRGTYYCPKCQK